jgi:hypothetical protein
VSRVSLALACPSASCIALIEHPAAINTLAKWCRRSWNVTDPGRPALARASRMISANVPRRHGSPRLLVKIRPSRPAGFSARSRQHVDGYLSKSSLEYRSHRPVGRFDCRRGEVVVG